MKLDEITRWFHMEKKTTSLHPQLSCSFHMTENSILILDQKLPFKTEGNLKVLIAKCSSLLIFLTEVIAVSDFKRKLWEDL